MASSRFQAKFVCLTRTKPERNVLPEAKLGHVNRKMNGTLINREMLKSSSLLVNPSMSASVRYTDLSLHAAVLGAQYSCECM
jgi:hypothetical protein